MERRVAVAGGLLLAAGIVLQVILSPPYDYLLEPGPLTGLVTFALHVLPTIFLVAIIVGALLLVMTLVWGTAGVRHPLAPSVGLVWGGLALITLAAGVDYLVYSSPAFFETMQSVPFRVFTLISSLLTALQVVGGGLIAFWLAGRLTTQSDPSHQQQLAPSRPF